jgi:N-acetylneuraminic acid mutarotase
MEVIVMRNISRLYLFMLAWLASLLLTSCGNGSSQSPPPVLYSIGGTATNLAAGDNLQLQNNGGDTLTVSANGAFTFATKLASGSAYSVTVSAQPSSPAQTCGVTNGSGTATANVTNVVVDCGHNEWAWMSGANIGSQPGTYGTQGVAAPGNVPGARFLAVRWTDASRNLWLFGGLGFDSTGTFVRLNDLWEYSGGQWTWIGGANVGYQLGAYGTQGIAAPGNIPGSRTGAATWADATGNFWMFGGYGYDSAGTAGYLNDLWKYDGGQWTWVAGADLANQAGTYGTQGTAAPSNIPGARSLPVVWADVTGNFWLFGGEGFDSVGTNGFLNDLWEYSGGEWMWVNGANLASQAGTYGTQGTAAPSNVPGARLGGVAWTDGSGNLWLFGGSGYDSAGTCALLNDLWKYSGGQWTWVAGASIAIQAGTYGTQGTPAPGNIPGARFNSVAWSDVPGNFWLFGGQGIDSAGTDGYLNDLWKYSGGQWTWVAGANLANQAGTYGTQGTAAPGNVPGARLGAASWYAGGYLWLFGGYGVDSTGASAWLNDTWAYEP